MMILVTYDVSTTDAAGALRLRRIAKACRNYGQRVQFSVFEIEVEPAAWVALREQLLGIIDTGRDSLRFYQLGANWERRVVHAGAKATLDLKGPLVF